MDARAHWEQVYATRRSDEVSWYQAEPATSLALIQRVAPDRHARIIDIGAGASLLADRLVAAGYVNLAVLDVSATALNTVRDRIPAAAAAKVTWIEADVLIAELPPQSIDVWHDRAVFHFLIKAADREAYVAKVQRTVRPGGHIVIATFAEDGPTSCSGLPVARYSAAELHAVFGPRFQIIDTEREQHVTPSGGRQSFQYCVYRLESTHSEAA